MPKHQDVWNRCAVCTKPVAPDKLMCARHWRLVPPPMQQEVYRSWRAANEPVRDGRFPLLTSYLKARAAAIAAVKLQMPAKSSLITPATPGATHADHE